MDESTPVLALPTRERINHETDQRAIAQPHLRGRVDRIEHAPSFLRRQHGCLAALHNMGRTAHRGGRIDRHDLADHKPIEQMADRGEALLNRRRRSRARQLLDIAGDVHRLHGRERLDASASHQVKNSYTACA
jgi:hypothetical protein